METVGEAVGWNGWGNYQCYQLRPIYHQIEDSGNIRLKYFPKTENSWTFSIRNCNFNHIKHSKFSILKNQSWQHWKFQRSNLAECCCSLSFLVVFGAILPKFHSSSLFQSSQLFGGPISQKRICKLIWILFSIRFSPYHVFAGLNNDF